MSRLGIFVDESGDMGSNSEFYLITLVFHDQQHSIDAQVSRLESMLGYLGISPKQSIHSAPIIRNEKEWRTLSLQTRQKIISCMLTFLRLTPISYKTFCIRKKKLLDLTQLPGRLASELGNFLKENLQYFQKFDQVVVYYDNGQSLVNNLINTVFQAYITNMEVKKISPSDYRLSQAADMICTLELIRNKIENGIDLSRSEKSFFGGKRRLERTFFKVLYALSFE